MLMNWNLHKSESYQMIRKQSNNRQQTIDVNTFKRKWQTKCNCSLIIIFQPPVLSRSRKKSGVGFRKLIQPSNSLTPCIISLKIYKNIFCYICFDSEVETHVLYLYSAHSWYYFKLMCIWVSSPPSIHL